MEKASIEYGFSAERERSRLRTGGVATIVAAKTAKESRGIFSPRKWNLMITAMLIGLGLAAGYGATLPDKNKTTTPDIPPAAEHLPEFLPPAVAKAETGDRSLTSADYLKLADMYQQARPGYDFSFMKTFFPIGERYYKIPDDDLAPIAIAVALTESDGIKKNQNDQGTFQVEDYTLTANLNDLKARMTNAGASYKLFTKDLTLNQKRHLAGYLTVADTYESVILHLAPNSSKETQYDLVALSYNRGTPVAKAVVEMYAAAHPSLDPATTDFWEMLNFAAGHPAELEKKAKLDRGTGNRVLELGSDYVSRFEEFLELNRSNSLFMVKGGQLTVTHQTIDLVRDACFHRAEAKVISYPNLKRFIPTPSPSAISRPP